MADRARIIGHWFVAGLLLGVPGAVAADLGSSDIIIHGDIKDFLSRAKKRGWQAPYIDSAWRVRHVVPVSERVAANAARHLGKKALVVLDLQREKIWSLRGDALLENTKSLLDFGDWVGQRKGYGNLLVQRRSREIALGGLGRLVVDLDYPLDAVLPERGRFYGSLHPISARIAVLNREAGRILFPKNISSIEEFSEYWLAGTVASRESPPPTRVSTKL